MLGEQDRIFLLEPHQLVPSTPNKHSPAAVAKQTNYMLELCAIGLNGKPVVDYLHYYTSPYLKSAAVAGALLFKNSPAEIMKKAYELGPAEEQAARHVYTVMGHLPEFASWIPGEQDEFDFSSHGVLRAPENYSEYFERIREMAIEIKSILRGDYRDETPFKWSKFRTISFFRTAAMMPLHRPVPEAEIFEELLGDTKVDL